MRLIKMTGGLGNQMFIYALYLRMRQRFPNTRIDLSDIRHYHVHNGYELTRVFDIQPKTFCIPQWMKKTLEFLFFRTILERHEKGSLRHYDGQVYWPLVYYKGFYQRLDYLCGIEDEVRQAFYFDEQKISTETRNMLRRIETDDTAVSLHVRRGDYQQAKYYASVGCVCNLTYYQKAITTMSSRLSNAHYYIFSDDSLWVRENLQPEGAVYVNWNRGDNSWQDMMLMSRCRHHIISNSTFSWWGAWLGTHGGKIVICPDHWYANDGGNVPLYPDNWIKISL